MRVPKVAHSVAIYGLSCTGKTSLAARLASLTGLEFAIVETRSRAVKDLVWPPETNYPQNSTGRLIVRRSSWFKGPAHDR